MLSNVLSWYPNSADIVYSSNSNGKRKLYNYDIFNMISQPISFKETDWFEVQAIHNDQFILHAWKRGIYLMDVVTKKTQRLAKAEFCRFFDYDKVKKKLMYSDNETAYIFDPLSMKRQKLINDSVEYIIDPLHQTFISVSSDNSKGLSIFFKDEIIFTVEKAFNIYLDPFYKKLIYVTEDDEIQKSTIHVFDLDDLKEIHKEEINGLIQNSNQVENSILFNFQLNQSYGLYLFDCREINLKPLELIEHKEQLFAVLSPNRNMVAVLRDFENSSQIETIDLESND